MLLKISGGGNCPLALPLVAGSAIKTFQLNFEIGATIFWYLVQHGQ